MAHYTHGWLGTLAGMLDMEEEHCRENLQHYESGPDHDTYAAFLADVLEMRKRLSLYDAADRLLDRLKAMVSGMECECDKADPEHPLCDICWSRQVIAKAEGRTE